MLWRRVGRDWPFGQARCVVLDAVFIALPVLFCVVSIGYVAACDRLMK